MSEPETVPTPPPAALPPPRPAVPKQSAARALQRELAKDVLTAQSKMYLVIVDLDDSVTEPENCLQIRECESTEALRLHLQDFKRRRANVVVRAFLGCEMPITSDPLEVLTPYGVLKVDEPPPPATGGAAYFGGNRLPQPKEPDSAETRDYQVEPGSELPHEYEPSGQDDTPV